MEWLKANQNKVVKVAWTVVILAIVITAFLGVNYPLYWQCGKAP